MGKTESGFDVIGHRLDTSPVPIAIIGPSSDFLSKNLEPRIQALLEESKSLRGKLARGKKMSKSRKVIAGVPLRLVHAGSASALSSDQFGLVMTDEVDKLMANVGKQGDPIGLADRRGDSYSDFVHYATSSPSVGPSDVVLDEDSGLEFWAEVDPKEIPSTIWQMWQSGTRYHWAWPCPHCGEYFIPRFRCLEWDKPRDERGRELPSTPIMALRTAHLVCPRNGCVIEDEDKEDMNARGVYVAPGQSVTSDGVVHGEPPDSWSLSYWVSGLASPFVPWGQRAAEYVEAGRTGDPNKIQSVVNGFGELFAPGDGDVPEWQEVANRRTTYRIGKIPPGVRILTMTVDVQKDRLVYVIRGWGAGATSWLIEAGELDGPPEETEVWKTLAVVMTTPIEDIPIRLVLIDSGFRPGKKIVVPEHRVYEFARRFPSLVRATKGSSSTMRKPVMVSPIDVKVNGKVFKKGVELVRLDPNFWKTWVHQKIRWPSGVPGAWHLPEDVSDDYCMQIVSEAMIRTPAGQVKWVPRSKHNHFLDCEAMQGAAAMMLNLSKLREGPPAQVRRAAVPDLGDDDEPETVAAEPAPAAAPRVRRPPPPKRSGWLSSRGSIW